MSARSRRLRVRAVSSRTSTVYWWFCLVVSAAGSVGLPNLVFHPAPASGMLDDPVWRVAVGVVGIPAFWALLVYCSWRVLQLIRAMPILMVAPDHQGGYVVRRLVGSRKGDCLAVPAGGTVRVRCRPASNHQLILGRPFMYEWTVSAGRGRLSCLSPLNLREPVVELVATTRGLEPLSGRRMDTAERTPEGA